MIDLTKYKGHLASEGQTWAWSKWMLKNAETVDQHTTTAFLLNDAPLLLEEVKRLNRFAHCAMNFMSKHDLHFQFLNEYGVYTSPDGGSISMFIPYSYKWDDETKVSNESIQFTVRGEEE
jgi:hypothetical protein